MTAASGDPGEKSHNEGQRPSEGSYEAPPIEQTPAYGGYQTQAPPAYPAYEAPAGPSYGVPTGSTYEPQYGAAYESPPGFPPAGGYTPQYGGSYPPPPPGYASPPEYGAPYPGGYGYPSAPPTGTNTLAIVSLVASVIGLLCGIGSIVGIVTGALAINQMKQTRQDGRGLAVAGIVVGVVTLLISIALAIYAYS